MLITTIFCFSAYSQGNKATEFTVSRGKTVSGFSFSRSGVLTYNKKRFSPSVIVGKEITEFKISKLTQKKWAGAIAVHENGLNQSFFLDTAKMTATPLLANSEGWNAAKKIYWSPSLKYMVVYCAYEGHSFVRIDTKTKSMRDTFIDKPGGSEATMWRIDTEPRWSGNKDILVFNVDEICNFYDYDCGEDKVLARYKVNLNITTLRISYSKL
jgi:hypothetical protein